MSVSVGIKYYGGCNPRYDRTALAALLRSRFDRLDFAVARDGGVYDVLLVLCGCSARCASLSNFSAGEVAIICSQDDAEKAFACLARALDKSGGVQ